TAGAGGGFLANDGERWRKRESLRLGRRRGSSLSRRPWRRVLPLRYSGRRSEVQLSDGSIAQDELRLPQLAPLPQIAVEQRARLAAHDLPSRRSATRSRIRAATSSFGNRGSSSCPPPASSKVTRLVDTSKPAPGSRASLTTSRSSCFSRSFLS